MQGNPYLPLWEHTPDGEPYVFEDPDQPGKMRIYIYGSHDTEKTGYCGRDQVVWSASVDSLNNWRYDGVIFSVDKNRDDVQLILQLTPDGTDGTITIMADRPWTSQGGKVLGTIELKADMPQRSTAVTTTLPELGSLAGKHAIFLVFSSPVKDKSICSLESLAFE